MKHFFTVLGIAGILVVALTVKNVGAQTTQPTPTATAITAVATLTPVPQVQNQQAAPAQQSGGRGMHGGMMAGKMGGRMGGRMGMQGAMNGSMRMNAGAGAMQGQVTVTAGGGYSMNHESMMYGVTPMHDDVARYMGMTTQELYNHMAAGKSMAQIAAQKGITEQQLMDSIMTGRRAAFNQAVMAGRMTQAQADAMLQNMSSNLKNMVDGQGYGSSGWGMMWDSQVAPQTTP